MAKRKIIWSARAKVDQFKILEYYFIRNGNKNYSSKLHQRFRSAIHLLAKNPKIGIQTDIQDIRCIFEGHYAIFYRLHKVQIEIVSIWDCRQDPEKLNI